MVVEITNNQIQAGITILQIIGLPIFLWIVRKLSQIHKSIKLNDYKHTALVNSLSKQFGNGEFKEDYEKSVDRLKVDNNFVYKE